MYMPYPIIDIFLILYMYASSVVGLYSVSLGISYRSSTLTSSKNGSISSFSVQIDTLSIYCGLPNPMPLLELSEYILFKPTARGKRYFDDSLLIAINGSSDVRDDFAVDWCAGVIKSYKTCAG